jgi:hypothetical protein
MKKTLLLLMLFTRFITLSQTECDNNVSTNPLAPTNNTLPQIGSSNQADNRYLNHFDWFPIGASGTPEAGLYLGYPLTNMNFSGVPIPYMSNIMSAQGTNSYYSYIYDGPLPLTENGWELLLVNVGKYPDNTTEIPILAADFKAFPYIVIYNRYTGVMRVFCKFGLDQTVVDAANAVEITIEFDEALNLSGLMRLYEGSDQALDVKTDVSKMSTITKAENFQNKWYSADFQIAYDPCQCYYPSNLRLKFAQIKNTNITAHARTIELPDQDLVNNSNLTVNPSDWLSGFDYTGNTAEGGIAIAKSLKIMASRYISELEAYKVELEAAQIHNAEVERKLVIMQLFEKIVIDGASSAISALIGTDLITRGITYCNELFNKEVIDTNLLKSEANKAMAQGVKGLKTLIAGEMKPLPQKPEMPTATFSETSYSGLSIIEGNYSGPRFFAPGTYGSPGTGKPVISSVYSYPVYNEILGSFALLESPKLRIKELNHDIVDKLTQKTALTTSGVFYALNIQRYQSWTKSYQIELAKDLKYSFNTTLDIKNYSIKASYTIISKKKKGNILSPNSMVNAFQNTSNNINVVFTNDEVSAFSPIVARNIPYNFYNQFPKLNDVNNLPVDPPSVDKSKFEMQTPVLPIDAFKPLKTRVSIKNEAISWGRNLLYLYELPTYNHTISYSENGNEIITFNLNDPKIIKPAQINPNDYSSGYGYDFEIELKLIVDIEFNTVNSSGKTNKTTQILTYKIDPTNISYTTNDADVANPTNNISINPENLNLIDINFDGQPVKGCKLLNNNYTCKAWNNISIEGNLTTSNGYTVDIKAGNEINQKNNSSVAPEIILSIEPVLDYSMPMPPSTKEYVSNFCQNASQNSASYQANEGSFKVVAAMEEEKIKKQNELAYNWDFNLFPNPATNSTTVLIDQMANSNFVVQLVDVTGKILFNETNNNQKSTNLDISNFKKGMYFVSVFSNGSSKTKQLVIY